MHFGEHVTIDGYGGNPELLNNKDLILTCFTELREKLGMHALIEPVIVEAFDNGIKDPGGWSGFVIIAESHISVHSFPNRRFISADVYTCQNGLDVDKVINFFKDTFELKDVETHFVKRGTKYPQENIL